MTAYHRPRSLGEALAIRAAGDVTVLAGGTDLYPARTARAAWGTPFRGDVLDLTGIEELRGVMERQDHWRIGALTTWADLARTALPPAFDAWRAAAREVGGVQVQSRGTLAGNLCTASPAGDGIPCLMALDASVELASAEGRRTLPVTAFVTGYRATALRPGEIVTALIVPRDASRSAFVKIGARRYLVISIVMVAANIVTDADGRIATARVAIGACGPHALRQTALERWLVGRHAGGDIDIAEDLLDLAPIDDVRASAPYRRAAARQAVADCLRALTQEAAQ